MKTKTKICPYCKSLISTKSHLLKCNPTIDINTSYISMIELNYKCKVDDVISDYLTGSSLPDIKIKYGLSYSVTNKILDIHNISIRTIKQSANHNRLEKYKKSCINKYGVDNVSKSVDIKNKKIKTFIKNYGVDNIFRVDGFTKYVTSIMLEKYGKARITNPKLISKKRLEFDEEKWKDIQNKIKQTIQERYGNVNENIWKYSSELEEKIKLVLNVNDIEFTSQKFIGGRSYDIHISNTNILIEINGDYWHANPKIYNSGEYINYAGKGLCLVNEIWDRDVEKSNIANSNGFDVVYMWEYDINNHIKTNTLNEFVLDNLINK